MGRLLGTAVLSCVLAACTVQPPGKALKDPSSAGPSFGAARDLSAFGPCTALPAEPEQWWMRKAAAPARPGTAVPGSCFHLFGTGGHRDVGVLVGLRDMAYDGEKAKFPGGHLARFDGHTTYLYCGEDDTGAECTAWATLAPERTLFVSTYQRGSDAGRMLPTVQRYLLHVLERLPRK
jgi:hypothetical protein